MKKFLLAVMCLIPLSGHCEVVAESFCFSLADKGSVNFELRTYFDPLTKWSGAFVKYSKSKSPISLVLKVANSEELDAQTPEQTTRTWLEVSEGEITGQYEMMSQGGSILSMTYTKKANGKQYAFEDNPNVNSSLENGCKW
ncbi:hypothetical protein ACIPIN_14655 [Pseudomonas sp. NPDC087697]|uniref:hypothetical protein n=1 Tax=Pseudomonas sp. NPDC087697 TaxID=3364447 RepID=UPI0037F19BEA